MKRWYIYLIIVCTFIVGITLGNYIGYQDKPVYGQAVISIDKALKYLDEMERSHQQIVDKPQYLDGVNTKLMGDLEFHKEMVKRYQEIEELIITLNSKWKQ